MIESLDIDRAREAVAAALRDVERRLQHLVQALAHGHGWVSIAGAASDRDAVERACRAYAAIDLGMDDEPGTSIVCLGVIGAPREVLLLAESVNTAKSELKAICAPLQRIRMRVPLRAGAAAATRVLPVIRVLLRNLQRSDLNLLAAYRRIPILTGHPAKVVYTRARTRSVYRKPVERIAELLANADGPGAIADRARLERLAARETHLALVRDHYENVRANVSFDGLDRRGRGRIQVAAELPLLFAIGRRTQLPLVSYPPAAAEPAERPPRRRRSKLEPRPYLSTLPVYRYLPSRRSP